MLDERNSLVFDYARMIVEIKPRTMVMENVPGILTMTTKEGIPVIDAFCRILEDGGFGTYDALKQTLINTSGSGLAMKGQPKTKESKKSKKPVTEESQEKQFVLNFSEAML